MAEQTFLNENEVLVTNSRFIAKGQTYALRNITSVRSEQIKKPIGWGIFMLAIGCILTFSPAFLLGIPLAAISIWALAFKKPEYKVVIKTSAADESAYVSTDKDFINRIVNAINDAIVGDFN